MIENPLRWYFGIYIQINILIITTILYGFNKITTESMVLLSIIAYLIALFWLEREYRIRAIKIYAESYERLKKAINEVVNNEQK